MSLLFSRYPRLGAIVIDWRCGTSPDPLYPSLSFPFSPSRPLSPTLACYIDSLFIVWQPPSAPSMKACAPTNYHVHNPHAQAARNDTYIRARARTHTRIKWIDAEYRVWDIVRFKTLTTGLEAKHLVFATFLCIGFCPFIMRYHVRQDICALVQ